MDFGEKLKALRTERGLTQEQLAARLYVSRTAVSKWETGGGSPNLDSLQAVARLFDVSVDDLLSADDLIVLARDERRSTARSSGMLSFGLLDVLAVVFAFIPLYGVDDGSFVRMANLADYGASVDFGASFAVMAAAVVSLMFVGAVEILLAAAGSRRAAASSPSFGFAVQALAVVLFAPPCSPTPQRSCSRCSWRRSSSATVFCARNPWSAAEVTHRVARATHRGLPPGGARRFIEVRTRKGSAASVRRKDGSMETTLMAAWLNDAFAAFDATILGGRCMRSQNVGASRSRPCSRR